MSCPEAVSAGIAVPWNGGAPGWTFLLRDFAAAMAQRGLGDEARHQLLVVNPARWLAFAPVP